MPSIAIFAQDPGTWAFDADNPTKQTEFASWVIAKNLWDMKQAGLEWSDGVMLDDDLTPLWNDQNTALAALIAALTIDAEFVAPAAIKTHAAALKNELTQAASWTASEGNLTRRAEILARGTAFLAVLYGTTADAETITAEDLTELWTAQNATLEALRSACQAVDFGWVGEEYVINALRGMYSALMTEASTAASFEMSAANLQRRAELLARGTAYLAPGILAWQAHQQYAWTAAEAEPDTPAEPDALTAAIASAQSGLLTFEKAQAEKLAGWIQAATEASMAITEEAQQP